MSTLPVFQLLLQDNPNLFTTEGLSSLLMDCVRLRYPERYNFIYPSLQNRQVYLALAGLGSGDTEDEEIIHRIMTDPKGWCLDAPDEVHEGQNFTIAWARCLVLTLVLTFFFTALSETTFKSFSNAWAFLG
ncbi:hypothetical protein [Nostoc sp. MG11]|uniref:hypothetical protein n=1 Tax=Nostoc sp. MG11 TaxID=2721166 RepID=UPI00186873B1|nr:hypothetical protein [Nostoc sp. MG11]